MMTIFICLVAVALLAATKLLKNDRMNMNLVSGGLGVLLVVLIVLRFTTCSNSAPPPAHVTVDRNWVVGWRLGELVAEALPEGGRVAVLQAEPNSEALAKVAESQLAGVRETLPEPSFEVVVQRPDFLKSMEPEGQPAEPQGGSGEDTLKDAKQAQAIVSFAYLPVSPRTTSFPPIYLLDAQGGGFWIAAMKAGVVQAAVTTHRDSSKINLTLKGGSPRERFDAIYEVFTPENVDTFH